MDDPSPNDVDVLFTPADLSRILHTPVETLRYWRNVGKGPHWFKVGRKVLYARSDVRNFIEDLRVPAPTSEHAS